MFTAMLKKLLPLIAIFTAVFMLSACGGGGEEGTEEENGYEIDYEEPTEDTSIRTLSVAMPQSFMSASLLVEAGANMRRQMAQDGIEFILDINTYEPGEHEAQLMRFQTMMMAGMGYDVFMFDGQPLWAYANSGFLADIYELIDQCPIVSRDDFYTNVFDAIEHNGRLITFPLTFGFRYIGINASLPQAFIDRFKGYSQINMYEILQIYNDLLQDYWDDFGQFSLFPFADPHRELLFAMGNFIDVNNRQASLTDDAFVSFLIALQQVNEFGGFMLRLDGLGMPIGNRALLSQEASTHVFSVPPMYYNPALAFFDLEDPYFVHYIPISGTCGGLEFNLNPFTWNSDFWGGFSISASADGPLAWEFIMNLLSVRMFYSTPQPGHQQLDPLFTFNTPILRSYFEPHRRTVFNHVLSRLEEMGHRVEGMAEIELAEDRVVVESQLRADAIARISMYNEMPIAISPFVPRSLYESVLDGLLAGFTAPEEAAHQLQNSLSLWLIE